jgi:tetratricopeptide (TPR) repeat protein
MWHSFSARYNTYYNGHTAYKEGMYTKEKGNKDNHTEMLPVFLVGNESSRTLGSSNFETAITKCQKAIQLHSISRRPKVEGGKKATPKMKPYLAQKEFNPFLRHAWMLMGEAQFQKGDFLEAAATFSYITRHYATQPLIVNEARAYLIRCYTELEWYYDAEDVVSRMKRDSITPRVRKIANLSEANLLLRQERYDEALPYLKKAAKETSSNLQEARLHFLIGQILQHQGQKQEAFKAYQSCVRQNPPYELTFNARIRQTEVMSGGKETKKMVRRLRNMAAEDKNKDYLDQIYYAMGNIYLAQRDTTNAISAYEKGREKSTRNGIEKGILVLRLAEIYWEQGRYDLAQGCYADAIGSLHKEHAKYEEVKRRSTVLDALVPFTSAVHLQDSLLYLSVAPEKERNEAIDRVIEALKRKEKEERANAADSDANARLQENGQTPSQQKRPAQQTGADKSWYFYNQTAVTQGKQTFKRSWGNRKLEDHWRRSNRTVVDFTADADAEASALSDSVSADSLVADSVAENKELTEVEDPHNRAYYMAQIPFSDEQKAAAHAIIQESLYEAALIEKDQLEDFPLAERTFTRLYSDYPNFEKMEEVYYQLFLLYSRWGQTVRANEFRDLLATYYPESDITKLITAPDFEYLARFGKEIEDSLYRATYQAYRDRQNEIVWANEAYAKEKFPKGANRPKFIFVDILSRIATVPADTLIQELRKLVGDYPESDVSQMAGMMIKGLESGRTIEGGALDIGSLWSMRTQRTEEQAANIAEGQQLLSDRETPFCFLIAYPTDSLDANRLLYNIAHFNFTAYLSRSLTITQQRGKALTQFVIGGFTSYEDAHEYAQRVPLSQELAQQLRYARTFLIAEANLNLLGTAYSYDDYQKFFDENFQPLNLDSELLPKEEEPLQRYEDELTPEELERLEQQRTKTNEEETYEDDGGEWY